MGKSSGAEAFLICQTQTTAHLFIEFLLLRTDSLPYRKDRVSQNFRIEGRNSDVRPIISVGIDLK